MMEEVYLQSDFDNRGLKHGFQFDKQSKLVNDLFVQLFKSATGLVQAAR